MTFGTAVRSSCGATGSPVTEGSVGKVIHVHAVGITPSKATFCTRALEIEVLLADEPA